MRKIFIVSLSLCIVTLLFWGSYVLFFKNNPYNAEVSTDVKTVTRPDEEPKPGPAGVNIFTGGPIEKVDIDGRILGATFDKEGKILWSVDADSRSVRKTDIFSGITTTLLELGYVPVFVRWSPDGSKALIQEKASGTERWHTVDFSSKSDVPLKAGITTPAWTNAGDRIVYRYATGDGKTRELDIADPDGKNWKKLADIPSTAPVTVASVPQSSLVAMWNLPGAFYETALRTVSLAGGSFDTVISGRFGADYLFSPKGDTIAVSAADRRGGNRMTLSLSNMNGGEFRSLNIPTFVGKAVWSASGRTIYYALPGDFPEDAVLPDDYRGRPIRTRDTFWSVDVVTGQQKRVIELSDLKDAYDATDLFLDSEGQYFFFIDRNDRKLYRIKL